MSLHVWGVDLVEVSFKGIHAFMAAAWLLFDFIVFWLHFDIKNPEIATERRLERARIMHGIDTIVAYIFLLMLPTGIVLCYITETAIFTTAWLNWKHVLYAVIIIDALYLIPISGTGASSGSWAMTVPTIRSTARSSDAIHHRRLIRHLPPLRHPCHPPARAPDRRRSWL